MLYFILIVFPKVIKPQAIQIFIHDTQQARLKLLTLCCIQQAFKHRILHPLSVINTLLCYLAQPSSSCCSFGIDVISYQH